MIKQLALERFRVMLLSLSTLSIRFKSAVSQTWLREDHCNSSIYSVVHWPGSRANQKVSDWRWSFFFGEYCVILMGSNVKHTTCDERWAKMIFTYNAGQILNNDLKKNVSLVFTLCILLLLTVIGNFLSLLWNQFITRNWVLKTFRNLCLELLVNSSSCSMPNKCEPTLTSFTHGVL